MGKAKEIPVAWEEPEPQRVIGRDFKHVKVKDGYQSESMYDYPPCRPFAESRAYRKEPKRYEDIG